MAASEPEKLTCRVGDLEIELTAVRARVDHFEETGTVIIELFHPLLTGLEPTLAHQVVRAAIIAVLDGRDPGSELIVRHADQPPRNEVSLAELRMFLDYLGL